MWIVYAFVILTVFTLIYLAYRFIKIIISVLFIVIFRQIYFLIYQKVALICIVVSLVLFLLLFLLTRKNIIKFLRKKFDIFVSDKPGIKNRYLQYMIDNSLSGEGELEDSIKLSYRLYVVFRILLKLCIMVGIINMMVQFFWNVSEIIRNDTFQFMDSYDIDIRYVGFIDLRILYIVFSIILFGYLYSRYIGLTDICHMGNFRFFDDLIPTILDNGILCHMPKGDDGPYQNLKMKICTAVAIQSNISPLYIHNKKVKLYLFPAFILVVKPFSIDVCYYNNIVIEYIETAFKIGIPPKDAIIIDEKWLHHNKDGSRNKTFAMRNNKCIYIISGSTIHFFANSYLDVTLGLSNKDSYKKLNEISKYQKKYYYMVNYYDEET